MLSKVSRLIAACTVFGATVLPASAQDNMGGGTMQGSTMTMQGSTAMQGGTMIGTGTTSAAMMGNPMMGGMMDETMRNYVSADEAGRARILAPMSLREQVEFLTRFYQMPITGQQMVSLGMVGPNVTDPNNMAGTTTGGTMGGTMQGGTMQGGTGGTPQGGGM